jgi:hypothetical protein
MMSGLALPNMTAGSPVKKPSAWPMNHASRAGSILTRLRISMMLSVPTANNLTVRQETSCVPTLSGDSGHVWLHRACFEPWRTWRRQEAVKALAEYRNYRRSLQTIPTPLRGLIVRAIRWCDRFGVSRIRGQKSIGGSHMNFESVWLHLQTIPYECNRRKNDEVTDKLFQE